MSFASDVKKELTTLEAGKKCCQLAQIAAFLRFAGSITLGSGGVGVKVSTTNPAVARRFITLMKDYFGARAALFVAESNQLTKSRTYVLSITPEMNADAILRETGILAVKEGSNYFPSVLPKEIIKKRCCRKSFLRGCFLACGSVSDPAKAYRLELKCNDNEDVAAELVKLIAGFGLKAKIAVRRGKYLVYIKDGEQIEDFMSIIGCSGMLFKFQNVRITKEMRNKANRIGNCESANMDKAVNAAQSQLIDIALIEQNLGLASLPEKLRTAAYARMDSPELSLAELAESFDPPISKSGLNHRFEKIAAIADSLRGRV